MRAAFLISAALLLSGCATSFPVHQPSDRFADGLTARQIFDRSLAAHGGDVRERARDVNLAIDGEWTFLVKRIQPIVTDADFRIRSEERMSPATQQYSVSWSGPGGVKQVVRKPGSIAVWYNGVPSQDAQKLRAAAMTADAFQLFHFGLSFLNWRGAQLERLPDAVELGVTYHRLIATLSPGFGESPLDRVVVWIDRSTDRLYRVHHTLEGFESTRGAHVDVTYLDYRQVGGLLFPVKFHERVMGPIRIDAHAWTMLGIDLDRGWRPDDISGARHEGAAAAPARRFQPAP